MVSVPELSATMGNGKAGSYSTGRLEQDGGSRKRAVCFWEFEIMRPLQVGFGTFVFTICFNMRLI